MPRQIHVFFCPALANQNYDQKPSPSEFTPKPQDYKKLAIEKYLHGEITRQELQTLLKGLEDQEKTREKPGDVAYQ